MSAVMKVGIISKEEYRQRTIAIAKGEYVAKNGEPKIWFESLQSMAQVLSNERAVKLLKPYLTATGAHFYSPPMAPGPVSR